MIGSSPLMLDELLENPLTTAEMEGIYGGVPAQQLPGSKLAIVPARYVTEHLDKTMDWAESWAEENFGTGEVNVRKMGDEVVFAPSPRTPLRHQ